MKTTKTPNISTTITTKATTTTTTTIITIATLATSKNATTNKSDINTSSKTVKADCSIIYSKQSLADNNKNVIVISVTVSAAALLNITMWIFLWR